MSISIDDKVKRLLTGKGENYILPFFWQHGEEEAVLREYMGAIQDCGIGAVCVESRPHPDYCGPKWWQDMDVILDEARTRNMKVWILDDSHFPTGYANNALAGMPDELCRQFIVCKKVEVEEGQKELSLSEEIIAHPEAFAPRGVENYFYKPEEVRQFADDQLFSITAVRSDANAEIVDLTGVIKNNQLTWQVPEGSWTIYICHLSRNFGPHRDYINMLDYDSCKVLLDAVYEPHYAKYKDDFGTTIAGFFSDEPEIGNGHLYETGVLLGMADDVPWSAELEKLLAERLGEGWKNQIALLWADDQEVDKTAYIRYVYMDLVSRLVEKNFSMQVGDWCRAHDVEYIGHLIEDNNQHARMSSSLGHFFRGLAGQDMAGIDDIGGQVLPQMEEAQIMSPLGAPRDGEFYHYALGKLGSSMAAIDPMKQGRCMCEIFGAYGWEEGVALEKYLIDHFLVRGVNRYVPHAFSPKDFPDDDCPPHFYAGGHDPQYRHFGELCRYLNRVCELISDGKHIAQAAILYHGEAEWTGSCMLMQKPAHLLADAQIDYDFIPSDVFTEIDRYKTVLGKTFAVNTQEYKAFIVPTAQYITENVAKACVRMAEEGFPVYFIDSLPEGICDTGKDTEKLLVDLRKCKVIALERLVEELVLINAQEIIINPSNNRVRYMHYQNGNDLYLLVNESDKDYKGTVSVPSTGSCYAYDAWDNELIALDAVQKGRRTEFAVMLEPRKSQIVIFGEPVRTPVPQLTCEGMKTLLNEGWTRSICEAIKYPDFKEAKTINLPDQLAEELPKFSGLVKYERTFTMEEIVAKAVLEITAAAEGVEVFVNGVSAGIQVVPVFRYDITKLLHAGDNAIVIEVATTLDRAVEKTGMAALMGSKEPTCLSGITGEVAVYIS